MPNLKECIGPAVRLARKEANMSQEDLAATLSVKLKIRVTQGYISKIETSCCNVSWERLALICTALKCKASHVVELAESLMNK